VRYTDIAALAWRKPRARVLAFAMALERASSDIERAKGSHLRFFDALYEQLRADEADDTALVKSWDARRAVQDALVAAQRTIDREGHDVAIADRHLHEASAIVTRYLQSAALSHSAYRGSVVPETTLSTKAVRKLAMLGARAEADLVFARAALSAILRDYGT
jgi:hypothetical protein